MRRRHRQPTVLRPHRSESAAAPTSSSGNDSTRLRALPTSFPAHRCGPLNTQGKVECIPVGHYCRCEISNRSKHTAGAPQERNNMNGRHYYERIDCRFLRTRDSGEFPTRSTKSFPVPLLCKLARPKAAAVSTVPYYVGIKPRRFFDRQSTRWGIRNSIPGGNRCLCTLHA